MTKLKPCPFCGGEAKMERTPINPYYYVICTNLECDATVGRFQPTEEEAAAAWNRRDGEQIMSDYKKLLNALHAIQDECRLYHECSDCPFVSKNKVSCGLILKLPYKWPIKTSYDIRLLEDGESNE